MQASSTETLELMGSKEKERLAADPMFRLEHGEADKRKARSAKGAIAALIKLQTKSDYDENAKLRRSFRTRRKQLEVDRGATAALLTKSSLEMSAVAILPEHPHDRAMARQVRFGGTAGDTLEQRKRAAARESIFTGQASATVASSLSHRAGKAAARGIEPGKFRLLNPDGKAGATRTALRAAGLVRPKRDGGRAACRAPPTPVSTTATDAPLVSGYDSD
jgi:hypothetical protein